MVKCSSACRPTLENVHLYRISSAREFRPPFREGGIDPSGGGSTSLPLIGNRAATPVAPVPSTSSASTAALLPILLLHVRRVQRRLDAIAPVSQVCGKIDPKLVADEFADIASPLLRCLHVDRGAPCSQLVTVICWAHREGEEAPFFSLLFGGSVLDLVVQDIIFIGWFWRIWQNHPMKKGEFVVMSLLPRRARPNDKLLLLDSVAAAGDSK